MTEPETQPDPLPTAMCLTLPPMLVTLHGTVCCATRIILLGLDGVYRCPCGRSQETLAKQKLQAIGWRSRQIALEYFRENPEARDGVMKAYHAYNVPHFRCDPKTHNFGNSLRESACHWCGRTREEVRWDELPPECAKRPPVPEIEDVILGEERKAFALLARAEKDVPKLVSKLGMNGEALAVLHHTHGYDPETVASIVDVPPQMLADYHAAMETERARSRAAQVKEVITVRTTGDVADPPNDRAKP